MNPVNWINEEMGPRLLWWSMSLPWNYPNNHMWHRYHSLALWQKMEKSTEGLRMQLFKSFEEGKRKYLLKGKWKWDMPIKRCKMAKRQGSAQEPEEQKEWNCAAHLITQIEGKLLGPRRFSIPRVANLRCILHSATIQEWEGRGTAEGGENSELVNAHPYI